MKLAKDFLDKERNITVDNYFTSLSLANQLYAQKTTLVGTLRSNRREVPEESKITRNRRRGDSKHYYAESTTLCSYWDKGNKPVLLLSTMHRAQRNTENWEDGKPDTYC